MTRPLRYGSVCSGIEAASVAWDVLPLRPAWFAEIASFQSRVLSVRWPSVPNRGDFTRIGHDRTDAVDVLVGGTPCQSFSVAGGRAGLDDPRGHLAVEFVLLARRLSARWVVWENVPGVLSVDGGDAFAAFVSLLVQVGYGVFWRVLDARWFGVPQRRRRVFLVGYLGDWRPPAAVLLERPSMRGNQGFPDDYTLIDDDTDDSPRYESLGNSMAVPVMRWIGRRLVMVNGLLGGA